EARRLREVFRCAEGNHRSEEARCQENAGKSPNGFRRTRSMARQRRLPSQPRPTSLVTIGVRRINAEHRLRPPAATIFVVWAAMSGCSGREQRADTLVIGLEAMPTDLDPRFGTDAASSRIGELVFRSLTRVDEHLEHVPDLALDWRFDAPLSVRFRLR